MRNPSWWYLYALSESKSIPPPKPSNPSRGSACTKSTNTNSMNHTHTQKNCEDKRRSEMLKVVTTHLACLLHIDEQSGATF